MNKSILSGLTSDQINELQEILKKIEALKKEREGLDAKILSLEEKYNSIITGSASPTSTKITAKTIANDVLTVCQASDEQIFNVQIIIDLLLNEKKITPEDIQKAKGAIRLVLLNKELFEKTGKRGLYKRIN